MAWLVLVLAASLSLSLVRSQRIAEGEDGVFADVVASGSGLDDGALTEERVNSEVLPSEELLNLFGGDMLLTAQQRALIERTSREEFGVTEEGLAAAPERDARAVVVETVAKWPNAVFFYDFAGNLGQNAKRAINEAISEYESSTCVRFQRRTNQRDYVRFIAGQGCYSYVGKTGGQQVISIGNGCEYRGVVMHEMFHALGRWHEQSRPDRDQFVRINFNNIRTGLDVNFAKLSTRVATTNGINYDVSSIMHYDAYAFTKNGRPTITPLDSRVAISTLGQRQHFTEKDRSHVRELYCNNDGQQPVWGQWSSWNSCSASCGGGTQTRSRSCSSGGSGCVGSSRQTRQCGTSSCPRSGRWGQWERWSTCSRQCGGGKQKRSRKCIGGGCSGDKKQSRICNTGPCTGRLGRWSEWEPCSASCGGGKQSRTRSCSGGLCFGNTRQTHKCQTQGCPRWSNWSNWSSCSARCSRGTQRRTRRCIGGNSCPGNSQQSRNCNGNACAPVPSGPATTALNKIGCYKFTGANVLRFLNENDPIRSNAVQGCAQLATSNGYSVFGVAGGFCISGSNSQTDYTQEASSWCRSNTGRVLSLYTFPTTYHMDVYSSSSRTSARDTPPSGRLSDVKRQSSGAAGLHSLQYAVITALLVITRCLLSF